jgi:hypothetical protein
MHGRKKIHNIKRRDDLLLGYDIDPLEIGKER